MSAARCAAPALVAALLAPVAAACAAGAPAAPAANALSGAPAAVRADTASDREAAGQPALRSSGRYAMGTALELTLVAPGGGGVEEAFDELFALAAELERQMSRHDPQSALSRLNAAAGRGPQPVPAQLLELIAESRAWTRRTHGSFDVTVGPLVALWEGAARENRLPAPAAVEAARAQVDATQIHLDPEAGTVALPGDGASIDLGGIAKGYALDRMAERLRARGIRGALLSFGQSSLWGLGAPPDGDGWRVLLRDAAGGFAGLVTLRDRALSVSGSLGQGSEIEGRRYGHVLDPRSGRPLTRRLSAAVVAPTATAAEALSTALLILGDGEGIALLESLPDTEGFLIDAAGARARSSGWDAAVRFEPWLPPAPPPP